MESAKMSDETSGTPSLRANLPKLRQILTERFDERELRTLCFHLGVDYDDLLGEDEPEKARELIVYLERGGRIADLLEVGRKLRPDVDFTEGGTTESAQTSDETLGTPALQANLTKLHQILMENFNEGELRTLCFDLGVDYDDLLGEDEAEKARELLAFLHRRGKIADLFEVGRKLQPDVHWNDALPTTEV